MYKNKNTQDYSITELQNAAKKIYDKLHERNGDWCIDIPSNMQYDDCKNSYQNSFNWWCTSGQHDTLYNPTNITNIVID